jgi:ribonuclease J
MSSKFIPGNEKSIGRMINQLFKQGAEVLYESMHEIHVSGHATRPELKRMLEAARPRFFIPIHGEYRHLVHHAAVAREVGVKPDNVHIAVNGEVVDLTRESCQIVDKFEDPRVLVEGREGQEMTRLVLRDRRHLAEKGVVFSLLVRNAESRRIVSGPEIIARGLVAESMEGWLLEEAKRIAKKVVTEYEALLDQHAPQMDLQENIRIELRRFFNQNIGKKPIVLPIILDI